MDIKFDSSGLDNLADEVKSLSDSLNGTVNITQILTDDFMNLYTHFDSFHTMLDNFGFSSADDFNTPQWNDFVSQNTAFESWEEMYSQAGSEFFANLF